MKILIKNGKIRIRKGIFVNALGFDNITGKIIYTGSYLNVNQKSYNEIIDLDGKLVIPAFHDGHCHLMKGAKMNAELDLRDASTREEFQKRITEYKLRLKPEEWIVGGYFSESNFKEPFVVDRNFIDMICPDIPVALSRTDLHSVILNSLAIELTGIESMKDTFKKEELIYFDDGTFSGECKERAMYYVFDCFPVKSERELCQILNDEIEKLLSYGIGSVTDISLSEDLKVYEQYFQSYNTPFRINSVLPFEYLEKRNEYVEIFKNYSDNINFRAFKAFYDGSLSSMTALFYENYKNTNSGGIRSEFVETGEFEKYLLAIDKANFQVAIHCIGDRAVGEVLNYYEMLEKMNGVRDRRFRIEHAQHIALQDIPRFVRKNIIISAQPAHLSFDAPTAQNLLKDFSGTHIYKRLMNYGIRIVIGTDFPVVKENPFENIFYAVTRKTKNFPHGFLPDYAFTLDDAIDSYTYQNAYANFEEKQRGTLELGKVADLIVLEKNIYNLSNDELQENRINMLFLSGKRIL
ncbi:MAG: amidohydrolase [Ignavibacteria bacterium]